MNRREFLKKTAKVVGVAAAGVTVGLGLNKIVENMAGGQRERVHRTEVIIVRKKSRMDLTPMTLDGKDVVPMPSVEDELTVLLNGKEERVRGVSRERFNSLKVGDKTVVTYETTDEGQKNVRMESQ